MKIYKVVNIPWNSWYGEDMYFDSREKAQDYIDKRKEQIKTELGEETDFVIHECDVR